MTVVVASKHHRVGGSGKPHHGEQAIAGVHLKHLLSVHFASSSADSGKVLRSWITRERADWGVIHDVVEQALVLLTT